MPTTLDSQISATPARKTPLNRSQIVGFWGA